MIRQTINILAAPDRRGIVRIVEGSDAEYTEQRYERDAAELAGLLALVLPVATLQDLAWRIANLNQAIQEKERTG